MGKRLKLLHKIIFLQNLNSNDLEEPRWSEVLETYAEIKALHSLSVSELEGINFGQVLNQEYFIFYVRFNSNISENMRIMFQGRLYEIKRIVEEYSRSRIIQIIGLRLTNSS